jgi:hypothetical protein
MKLLDNIYNKLGLKKFIPAERLPNFNLIKRFRNLIKTLTRNLWKA